jgi:hypothetical protein
VGMPEGKRPLGRPRRRWVDNIKMDLREIGWDGVDWIDMACEHRTEPSGPINCRGVFSSCASGSFSRRAQLHGDACL